MSQFLNRWTAALIAGSPGILLPKRWTHALKR